MVDFTNLEFYNEPLISYALVGITTVVLAYATSLSGKEKVAAAEKAVESVAANPLTPIGNPFNAEPDESKKEEPNPTSEEPKDVNSESPPKITGGKKRRQKTPRSKKHAKKTKHVYSRK